MKVFKKLLSLALVCAMTLLLFVGCADRTQTSSDEPASVVDETQSMEETTIRLVDHLGRTVELPTPAQRVIGTHNPSMNMVVVLDGNGSRFAGFGNKDMAYGLYDLVAPEINEVTQIGKGKNINMETVMTVNPDLIVMPVRFKDMIDQLAEIGVPSIALDVEKFDSIKDGLILVGKAIGQDERAEELVTFFDKKISEISAVAEKVTEKPTVLMLSGSSKTSVSTDKMLQNLMVDTAGGVNVTAGFQAEELWTEVNIEQIIAWNPEVVYIPVYADYTVEDILKDPQWASISAIQNKKVFQFPSKLEPWDYPVAASLLGLCWTCYNLHPEHYSFEELMEDANEFYQIVYGQTFTAEQLGISK
ncbi:ABC transporter substrate-binding protein [Clostridium aceticum]|nr:ABC transporter substrate-binding protein [Clostridium aceticum]